MKYLVKTGNGYVEESVSGLNAVVNVLKTPIKPVLGEPLSTQEAIVSDIFYFLVGAVVGGTVGYRYVKKAQSAYQALRGGASDQHLASYDDAEDEYEESAPSSHA